MLCVEEALTRIERNPAQFQMVHRRVARAVLHRFPYSVFFIVVGPAIIVTAVMHVRRNPSRWRARDPAKAKNIQNMPLEFFTRHAALREQGHTSLLFTAYIIEAVRKALEEDEQS
jgi:hypothetical protein